MKMIVTIDTVKIFVKPKPQNKYELSNSFLENMKKAFPSHVSGFFASQKVIAKKEIFFTTMKILQNLVKNKIEIKIKTIERIAEVFEIDLETVNQLIKNTSNPCSEPNLFDFSDLVIDMLTALDFDEKQWNGYFISVEGYYKDSTEEMLVKYLEPGGKIW